MPIRCPQDWSLVLIRHIDRLADKGWLFQILPGSAKFHKAGVTNAGLWRSDG